MRAKGEGECLLEKRELDKKKIEEFILIKSSERISLIFEI